VPHVSFGPSVRALVTRANPQPTDAFRIAAEPVAAHFGTVATAAEGCDALVATDLMPVGARSVTELEGFLQAGAPPVYVGFGSMAMRASADVARPAVEAVRAQGRRVLVGRGWADLAPIDDRDDCFAVGEVNHEALFPRPPSSTTAAGGTTTTAALAGVPQVVVPQIADQPLGRPGGRTGHRRGPRRPGPDVRVPVGRAQGGPGPRDPRPRDRRGGHDPHRRGGGGREAAARGNELASEPLT
jgi:hypothetical protein